MSREREKLLGVNVAAKRLGCTDQHVRRLVRQGKIDAHRESERKTYIPESAVEALGGKRPKFPKAVRRLTQAEIKLKVVAQARELMGLMGNWQNLAGQTNGEIATGLMNIGLRVLQEVYLDSLSAQRTAGGE